MPTLYKVFMNHSTYDWKNKKGQHIFAQRWLPDGKPVAVICHVHGQSDHSSRFEHVAGFFVDHDIAFIAIDLIGHGKSAGARGHIRSFKEYTESVDMLLDEAEKLFPAVPVFVYGHSMGGTIVLHHSFNTSRNIKGYIVTSPWIKLAFEPPAWKVALGKTIKSIFPALLQPTGLVASLISHDEEVVQKYMNDKLVHGKISASAFFEILTHGHAILDHEDDLKYPVLLMHGTGDKITSCDASRTFANKHQKNLTFIEMDGLYHEMHNEPQQLTVFNEMLNWIKNTINK